MSVSPSKAIKRNFFGVVKPEPKQATVTGLKDEKSPTSARKWTDGLQRPLSQRELRRIKNREINSQTKKFRRDQRRSQRAAVKHNERQAIIVLQAIEKGHGLERGGLREQLIEEGALEATRERVIGYEVHEHPEVGPVTIDITKAVPIGHTPVEILSAAGLTPEKIAEAHAALAGGDVVEVSA
jgi:hypothetical protein